MYLLGGKAFSSYQSTLLKSVARQPQPSKKLLTSDEAGPPPATSPTAGAAAAVAASLTRSAKHFRFSSNYGHIAAPHEPTQWAIKRHSAGFAFGSRWPAL
jgi:hypothetical protein